MSKPSSTALACTASTSATPTEMPGAAMSSLLMMLTWALGLAGDATVTIQPMSIATSRPSRSTKKSRVSAGRSDLMLGTALLAIALAARSVALELQRARGAALYLRDHLVRWRAVRVDPRPALRVEHPGQP